MRYYENGILVTDERELLDLDVIHEFLSTQSYWAKGRSREAVLKSIERSLCFGAFKDDRQIGFARVISDFTTFAYLCDVYVLPEFRNAGAGTFLTRCVVGHPDLRGVNWLLKTTFAQTLYKKVGFSEMNSAAGWMRRGACCG